MVAWLIRGVLALAVVAVLALALGSQPTRQSEIGGTAAAQGGATTAPATDRQAGDSSSGDAVIAIPTPRPTLEPFVERIVSRVTRETPAPYPTSTPLPDGLKLVSIVDFGYMPSVLRIHVGQTVIWSNDGREEHDVTGDDDWHSGPIVAPAEYRHTFGFAGTFAYRCSVHPDMVGTIIVTP